MSINGRFLNKKRFYFLEFSKKNCTKVRQARNTSFTIIIGVKPTVIERETELDSIEIKSRIYFKNWVI